MKVVILGILAVLTKVNGLENGVGLTPPMGWMTWQRFRCIVDCDLYPDDCISEWNFKKQADLMVEQGFLEAGYKYIVVDDCWIARERSPEGKLLPDPIRFPSGIKALSDYIHSKGLKFGIYEDYGNYTCAGYPGILGHLEEDAKTFGEWEVDYIKIDACYQPKNIEQGYIEFGKYLNETGRPIIYSCSWPAYQETSGIEADYELLAKHCNMWRNYGDIDDSWNSVTAISDWFAKVQDRIAPYHGPGHWNDPDMLVIGNFGLSYDQSKAQMAIWCVMGAPLLMSVDFSTLQESFRQIMLNKDAIAINQDILGIQGKLVHKVNNIHVWQKPITPVISEEHSYGLAFVSRRTDGYPYYVTISLEDLNMKNPYGYKIESIFVEDKVEEFIPSGGSFAFKVNPTGAIFVKATPLESSKIFKKTISYETEPDFIKV